MEKRIIEVKSLSNKRPSSDVAYWMSKPPQERFSAIEFLRSQWYETPPDFKEFLELFNSKDLTDIEALQG